MTKDEVQQKQLSEKDGIELLKNTINNFVNHTCGDHSKCFHKIPWIKKGKILFNMMKINSY